MWALDGGRVLKEVRSGRLAEGYHSSDGTFVGCHAHHDGTLGDSTAFMRVSLDG